MSQSRVLGQLLLAAHHITDAQLAAALREPPVDPAAAARHQSPDCVLATLAKAGYDLSAVRDELQEQHQKPLAGPLVPALDCACDREDEGTV